MTSPQRTWRRPVALTAAALMAATLTSCAESQRDESSSSDGSGKGKDAKVFVFGSASDPAMLDPALASDGETFRVANQMFEGLVGTKPGTADTQPLLAESWEVSEDGKTYTFALKKGVKFHDGTEFNAEAVCKNFDRWYNWTGINQSENISYYYNSLFKGFKKNEAENAGEAVYKSCEATNPAEAKVTLAKPFATFISALSLPAFSMQSPTAMEKYNADNTTGDAKDPRFSEYATKHPTGTGPFMLDKWDRGQKLTLKPYKDYWGEKAKLDKVIIKPMADGKARMQALKNNEIDAYDMVAPGDLEGLKKDGYNIMARQPFTILYLGLNQSNPALAKPEVRKAISHAIDKKAVAKQSLPEGTKLATQFMPDTVKGYNNDVPTYDYNPEEAKKLLKAAGEENLTLKFVYPTGVSRPYMPTPEDTHVAIKAQLEAVGIKVEPVSKKWTPDYLETIQSTKDHDLHLLGWTGDYNSADNFLGVFFGSKSSEWGFDNPALFKALDDARQLPTAEKQQPAYEAVSKQIMEFVPGVPIAHPVPSLAFNKKVKGYQTSPVSNEVWNTVTVGK